MEKVELPDFDEMFTLIESIRELAINQGLLKIELKAKEAEINREALNNEKYFINNKPPTQTYIDNTWKYTGFEDELLPKRNELARVYGDLEYTRLKLDLLKTLTEIWRTQSANERTAF